MEYKIHEKTAEIFISGELDHHTLREISREILDIIDVYLPKKLIVDMKYVTFMDSSGIAMAINAVRRMNELSGDVTLREVPVFAMKIFIMAGISRYVCFEEGGKAV